MKTSKFVQLDPKVLMEYVYDDSYLVAENYVVTHNLNDDTLNFSANNDSGSNNRYANQFVVIDPITNKAGVRDSSNYNFLQDRNYTQNLPIKYDRVKLHFPIDYNFEDYAGCYLKIYALDYNNDEMVSLSSYFFDKQNQDRFNKELQLSSPPNTLNGKLWGKYIELSYPSPNVISAQRTNNIANPNSINYNISNGVGLSHTAPVMIEFGFITQKTVINTVPTYLLKSPYQTSVPQTPDFENLAITIEPSVDGDWFEIFGTFNGTIGEFNQWINTSIQIGKRYYVEYVITMFEENIKGKSMTIQITDDFNEKIEYRPIIKYSSTTAAIEVIMNIIDMVDGSIITRRSSYGLMPNEISKYSRSLVRINVNGIKSPIIYNLRNGGSIFDAFEGLNKRSYNEFGSNNLSIETIKVPFPLLVSSNNVVAKSESALIDGKEWKGNGKLKIVVNPFDNLFKFTIAKSIENTVEYFDLLNVGKIHMYFKNYDFEVQTELYRKSEEIDLGNGTVVFKLKKEDINGVRRIYQSGINMFYITSTNDNDEVTVIYEGTFIMSDSIQYLNDLAIDYQNSNVNVQINRDNGQEFAIVTRRRVNNTTSTSTSSVTASDLRNIAVNRNDSIIDPNRESGNLGDSI